MRRAVLSRSVLAVLPVVVLLAAALPAQAEYTKIYKCQNTYDFDQGYLRAITNALEVVTPGGTTSWPLQWNPPLVGSCLWNGVYCTKLRYGGVTPYVIPGAWGKIGWTTADNSCRLSDFVWLAPSGKLRPVHPALERRIGLVQGLVVLEITTLYATATDAGAQVMFTLSSDAEVTATVLNIAGRPIRRLCAERACTAGVNTLLWNARADSGLMVPGGTYLIQVEARGADGSRSQAVTRLNLRR